MATMCVLEDVCCDILACNGVFRDTFLITAHLGYKECEVKNSRGAMRARTNERTCKVRLWTFALPSETTHTTTFFHPSGPQVFDLPRVQRWAIFLMTLCTTVSEPVVWNSRCAGNARIHCADEQHFILVVHGHDDEQFCLTAVEIRTKGILGGHEMVGVAGSGGVAHLGHLLYIRHVLWHDVGGNGDV